MKFHEIFSRWKKNQWFFIQTFQSFNENFTNSRATDFQVYLQCNHHHNHHHFWLSPLTLRSTTHSQQPPEGSVLSNGSSGFTTADYRQRLKAVIRRRRGVLSGFCSADQSHLYVLTYASGGGGRPFV